MIEEEEFIEKYNHESYSISWQHKELSLGLRGTLGFPRFGKRVNASHASLSLTLLLFLSLEFAKVCLLLPDLKEQLVKWRSQ